MYINTARKTWDMLDANAFRRMITEHWGEGSAAVAAMGDANTNWQDQLLRTTVSQDYNLSVGGTAGFLPYRVSASYTNNQGILKGSGMERVTAGFNLTPKFFNGLLQVNANVKGYYVRNTFTDEGSMGEATAWDPTRPVYQDWKVVGGTAAANGITHLSTDTLLQYPTRMRSIPTVSATRCRTSLTATTRPMCSAATAIFRSTMLSISFPSCTSTSISAMT